MSFTPPLGEPLCKSEKVRENTEKHTQRYSTMEKTEKLLNNHQQKICAARKWELGRYTPAESRRLLHVASHGFALKQFAGFGRSVPLIDCSHESRDECAALSRFTPDQCRYIRFTGHSSCDA